MRLVLGGRMSNTCYSDKFNVQETRTTVHNKLTHNKQQITYRTAPKPMFRKTINKN